MIGQQQRNILNDLGIDLWIPRDVACQNLTALSIWRDQSESSVADVAWIEQSVPTQPDIVVKSVVPIKHNNSVESLVVESLPIEKVQHSSDTSLILEPVQLQLLSLPHVVIVIDATHLSHATQQLWHNIQQAIHAEYQVLNWPFPMLNFQDNRGLQHYIQGFLDVHCLDKKIICLGEIPQMKGEILQLASLDELIEQPILKKRLWQLLQ